MVTKSQSSAIGWSTLHRGWTIAVAVIAIVLGLIAFLIPQATLLTVAIVFGTFLVASGSFQLVSAFTSTQLLGWLRWFTGLLGGLTLVAAILCLSNPWNSLTVLSTVIGAGWVFGGAASIAERAGRKDALRWLPATAGIASFIAGILVMIMPVLGLASFVIVAAILMMLVGISTLFLLSTGSRASTPVAGAESA